MLVFPSLAWSADVPRAYQAADRYHPAGTEELAIPTQTVSAMPHAYAQRACLPVHACMYIHASGLLIDHKQLYGARLQWGQVAV